MDVKSSNLISKATISKLRNIHKLSKQKDQEVEMALMLELDSFLENFVEVYNLSAA